MCFVSSDTLSMSPALREWESVGIKLEASILLAYIACLPLLCQGSKWLTGKSIWLVRLFRRSWVRIPAGSRIFFRGFISHSLSENIITQYELKSAILCSMTSVVSFSCLHILVIVTFISKIYVAIFIDVLVCCYTFNLFSVILTVRTALKYQFHYFLLQFSLVQSVLDKCWLKCIYLVLV